MRVSKWMSRAILAVLATGSIAFLPTAAPAQYGAEATVYRFFEAPEPGRLYAFGTTRALLRDAVRILECQGWETDGDVHFGPLYELNGQLGYWQYIE